MSFRSNFLGPVQGMGIYSPLGDVSAVAVTQNGTTRVNLSSPLTNLGTDSDDPMVTITMPVAGTAANGQTSNLSLDPKVSSWLDPDSQKYPVELTSGSVTVGGKISVSGVVPSSGVVPAGTKLVIKGLGFPQRVRVDVGEAIVKTTRFVNSSRVEVTLAGDYDITGQRIRVRDKDSNDRVEFFPYQLTTPIGVSTHALIAASYPMFSRTTYTEGYFRPVLSGSVFSGLALQNVTNVATTATVELYASDGSLLTSVSVDLQASSRIARDLAELLPGVVASNGTSLHVTAPTPIQMLGLLGNDASGVVLPVPPRTTP
ncbi:MAG TPA: IPT/TIG domain-containing protein [Terriglobales bacterium]